MKVKSSGELRNDRGIELTSTPADGLIINGR